MDNESDNESFDIEATAQSATELALASLLPENSNQNVRRRTRILGIGVL